MWDKLNRAQQPTLDMIKGLVNNPLWDELCGHIEREYASNQLIEYSGCGAMPGWNVKYKKAGRGLCTLYPMEGYFVALVVIGRREKQHTELMLPGLCEYTRNLYHNTQEGMDQRWLMIEVKCEEVLKDVKRLIAIRRSAK